MKYFLIAITALFSVNSLAARHKIFQRYVGIVKRAASIAVFSIDTNPVEEEVQDSTKKYVAGYPVMNAVTLTHTKTANLKKAVLQQENYLSDATKRCPFEGRYAVVFTKGKKKVTIITSSSACRKVKVYLPGTSLAAQSYDLPDSNSIEKALAE